MDEIHFPSLASKIPDEASAYAFLEELRWNGRPVCPHCGVVDHAYYLNPMNGGRKTRTGAISPRRVWKCGACRKQFTVLVGTIFHGSKIPVRTWLFVVFEMCSSKNGVAAREIQRKYKLSPKSAWFMCHRIREAMRREPMAGLLRGTIVADEVFIGGKPRLKRGKLEGQPGEKVYPPKTAVLSLIHKESGEVRSRVIPNVTSETLYGVINDEVDMRGSTLHTDEAHAYRAIGNQFDSHEAVWHSGGEYVRGKVTTNQAESYFSQLKRSLNGTHHHVSREHLHRYLDEFDMRFSTCKMGDSERMRRVIDQSAGRRLSYRPLTARDEA